MIRALIRPRISPIPGARVIPSPASTRYVATVEPFPGLLGWIATAAVVVAYDIWAVRHREPTMSRTLGNYLSQPVLGPALAGAFTGLAYHLLVNERLTSIDNALIENVKGIVTPASHPVTP